ncbi:uncharacterized protein LOC114525578 isoform X2 [Dendronephthya gigantea]|uniref:uncharacterized protein LOC114525578 isoform X2 n=1 Tax=Dendronephthya gigantea TaxID=151771 RepID=UPI00106A1DDA|nr:uncharacterized protein LOC114525578 isoform X2 [Dendronephthya gigantea]
MSGEEIQKNSASVGDVPNTLLESELQQTYILVLNFISKNLGKEEEVQDLAKEFLDEDLENATDVLFKLDERGIISVSDLSCLRLYFVTIDKYELVHTIDLFHQREYLLPNSNLTRLIKPETILVSGEDGNPHTATSAILPDDPSTDPGRRTSLLEPSGTSLNQCSHFIRRCYVKFGCCNRFWSCHHCHNSRSSCGRRDLRSSETVQVMCAKCRKVQQVSHRCSGCGKKFAPYYCRECKHFCGQEDVPYHCDKCGVCRERSCHCDTCGICMDIQHYGNHICREGPAHNEVSFTESRVPASLHKPYIEDESQMTKNLPDFPLFQELIIGNLSARDDNKFTSWAEEEFSVKSGNAAQVLSRLKVSELSPMKDYFQSEGRIELVHIVDKFLEGDCRSLYSVQRAVHRRMKKSENRTPVMSGQDRNPGTSGNSENTNDPLLEEQTSFRPKPSSSSNLSANRMVSPFDGTVTGEFSTELSLCFHFQRKCYVKFECCDDFWPCHRCHNNQSLCGNKSRKSREISMVKCAKCRKVQQVSQSCSHCDAKFADYYCVTCKHLTGKESGTYHCDKCGVCRIHKDRSFHCDICDVCFEEQRESHVCPEESGHEKCCVCSQDAFTGYQTLPCSHRVHRECENQIRRNGRRRCPICQESFAKGDQTSTSNSRRRSFGG